MHALQLFDSPETRVAAMSAYAQHGLSSGDAVMLVLAAPHQRLLRKALEDAGIVVDDLIASRQLTLQSAESALTQFIRRDRVDPDAFDASAGALLRQRLEKFPQVWVGGEAVDLLARVNDFDNAAALEMLWTDVAAALPVRVFCSYSSEHFGNPRHAAELQRICRLHDHVRSDPQDVLGDYLLRTRATVLE
jgi:hypothetical protein